MAQFHSPNAIYSLLQVSPICDDDICDDLRDLVPLIQLKKREKHPWRSVTSNKVGILPNHVKRLIYSSCFTEEHTRLGNTG